MRRVVYTQGYGRHTRVDTLRWYGRHTRVNTLGGIPWVVYSLGTSYYPGGV